jgi:hypothetical protein
MYTFAGDSPFDVDALRSRLARMDDKALARFGRAAAYSKPIPSGFLVLS